MGLGKDHSTDQREGGRRRYSKEYRANDLTVTVTVRVRVRVTVRIEVGVRVRVRVRVRGSD